MLCLGCCLKPHGCFLTSLPQRRPGGPHNSAAACLLEVLAGSQQALTHLKSVAGHSIYHTMPFPVSTAVSWPDSLASTLDPRIVLEKQSGNCVGQIYCQSTYQLASAAYKSASVNVNSNSLTSAAVAIFLLRSACSGDCDTPLFGQARQPGQPSRCSHLVLNMESTV